MLQNDPWQLIDSLQSVIISSLGEDGIPHTSYAPFVQNEQTFFISVSAMSAHSRNLLKMQKTSILFIEDEVKSHNMFARKRVSFVVQITPVERNSVTYNGTMTLFEDKFGELANIYRSLPDFYMLALTPISGRAVFGFGQAYDFKEGHFQTVAARR